MRPPSWDDTHHLVPLLVRSVAFVAVLLVPVRAVEKGYFPGDDALSHSAKVVSGKDWDQLLVRRHEIRMDGHPGWHAMLGGFRWLTGAGAPALVLFSVVLGFALFGLPAVLGLARPEAWLAAGIVLGVTDPAMVSRFLIGRPFLVTASVMMVAGTLAPRIGGAGLPWSAVGAVAAASALATWAHGGWYQLAIPVTAFILAGDARVARRVAAAVALGILVGGAMTGQPLVFLGQSIAHLWLVLGTLPAVSLVAELQPAMIAPPFAVAVAGFLAWGTLRGGGTAPLRDPLFVLVLLGASLGYLSTRFWTDWGLPSALLFMAHHVQRDLERCMGPESVRRAALSLALAVVFVLSLSSDVGGRFSAAPRPTFVSAADPAHRAWLPEPGGTFYTADMRLYFRAFFHNPDAGWRYVLGFEPAQMRPEDLVVYGAFARDPGSLGAFAPWVRRMAPGDRLVVTHAGPEPPPLADLEWHELQRGVWSGRTPRDHPAGRPRPLD